MKVLKVIRGLPSKNYPLEGIFELDQIMALINLGIEVEILILRFNSIRTNKRIGFYHEKYKELNIHTLSLPLGSLNNLLFNFIAKVFIYSYRKKIITALNDVNIIHSHFLNISNLAIVINKILCRPHISTIHDSFLMKNDISLYHKIKLKKVLKKTEQIIVVSELLQKNILKFHSKEKNKILVIPNVVSLDFEFSEDSISKNNGIKKIINVGNLIPRKRVDLLIKAFHKVNLIDNSTELIIIGDGPEKPSLVKLSKELGILDNIVFHGRKDRQFIYRELQKSNLFVLTSRAETFGVVLIEAMVCGLPLISVKCGGPEEIISKATGLLCSDDVEDISKNILHILDNLSFYNHDKIKELAVDKYSPQRISESLLKCYKSVNIN